MSQVSLEQLDRVVVIGTSCSGKTTLVRNIARIRGVKHIELDELHWAPDWVERDDEEFRSLVRDAAAHERWASDGNYGQVRDILWGRATTVIWLNYSFPLVLYRCLKRTTRRVLLQEELFSGNRESFRRSFLSRDSIILWVLHTHHRRRHTYPALMADPRYRHIRFITFNSPRQTERFLRDLERRRSAG